MGGLFRDKVVFLTGASSGIGAALGVAFAREGAKVALAARRTDWLEKVKKEIEANGGEAIVCACDVCDRSSIDAAIAATVGAFGGIDVVMANAGFGVSGATQTLETDAFRSQFETNVFGAIDTLYAGLPHLIQSKGRYGVVASVMGRVGMPMGAPYAASKFALVGFAESIYFDLAASGVSVTCINPGLVKSHIRMTDNDGKYKEHRKDPAPQWIVMPAETAARQIVRALYHRKPEVVITKHGKLMVFLSRHFPRTWRLGLKLATAKNLDKVQKLKRGNPDTEKEAQ